MYQLIEATNRHTLVPFIGAGLSVGAGLPTWYELLTKLAERARIDLPPKEWVSGEHLIDAAQAYVNVHGLQSMLMFLKDELDTINILPTRAHYALARLPFSLIFTANYDDLLERAYRQVGKHVHIVVNTDDIAFMRNDVDSVNIVKLYGSLDQPASIVLAREQYEGFFRKKARLIGLLESELGRSHMLYIGWSLSDPYFNQVFGEVLSQFGSFMRSGWAIMFDVPSEKIVELQRKKVNVITLESSAERTSLVANWLEALATEVGSAE